MCMGAVLIFFVPVSLILCPSLCFEVAKGAENKPSHLYSKPERLLKSETQHCSCAVFLAGFNCLQYGVTALYN